MIYAMEKDLRYLMMINTGFVFSYVFILPFSFVDQVLNFNSMKLLLSHALTCNDLLFFLHS